MVRIASVAALAVALAACGKDSSGPPAGFECQGQPLPTTAPNPLHVQGQIKSNALSPNALSGAQVSAFRTGNATALAVDTSDTIGFYSLTVATGGTPVDGYVQVLATGLLPTYGYPPAPLAVDAIDNVLVISSGEFTALAGAVNVTPTAGDGFIGVVVEDCQGTAIAGATVTTTPPGTIKYNANGAPNANATVTGADGVAYVFNVPAGNVTVAATGAGQTLRAHVVNARADAVTLTQIQP